MEAGKGSLGTGDVKLDRLFVYGTLRPAGHAFHLVEPVVIRHQPAVLTGYRLVGEGHRYPWCVESPAGEVVGELLWLAETEATLPLLDAYEGVEEERPEYCRVVRDVATGQEIIPAWVYVGGMGVPTDAGAIDTGDWSI
ncbi:MAG TPA: gamma-glutamylcyclotransferase family protein [Acidimicrobiia bacterium]|nr:gamma-glutamylcyclotransferase family protein [Acidimicrobiia bacterium]